MTKHWVVFPAVMILLVSSASPQGAAAGNATPAATSDPQAVLLANQARLALTGGHPVSDTSMSGAIQWIVGGTSASGSATLQQRGTAEARLDISAGAVSRSEIRNDTNGPAGASSGADGVLHASATHNCWGPAPRVAPKAEVQTLFGTDAPTTTVRRESRNGLILDHLHAYRNLSDKNQHTAKVLQNLSSFDVYLDPASHLPLVVTFNAHPDNDLGRDVPVEIRFADYQSVNGVALPFRIQRLLQGVLNLDLTVTSAATNSGISDSAFALR